MGSTQETNQRLHWIRGGEGILWHWPRLGVVLCLVIEAQPPGFGALAKKAPQLTPTLGVANCPGDEGCSWCNSS